MGSSLTLALAMFAISADNDTPYVKVQHVVQTAVYSEQALPTPRASARLVSGYHKFDFGGEPELVQSPSDASGSCCSSSGCGESRCRCTPLPSLHSHTGSMMQHIPYISEPKSDYYFRPYNVLQIAPQQSEVMHYGGNIRSPYDNSMFDKVYDKMRSKLVKKTIGSK